jgi:hypothetical protein
MEAEVRAGNEGCRPAGEHESSGVAAWNGGVWSFLVWLLALIPTL